MTIMQAVQAADARFFDPPRRYIQQLVYQDGQHSPAGYGWGAWLPLKTWRLVIPLLRVADAEYIRETAEAFGEHVDPIGIHLVDQLWLQDVKRALRILDRRAVQATFSRVYR